MNEYSKQITVIPYKSDHTSKPNGTNHPNPTIDDLLKRAETFLEQMKTRKEYSRQQIVVQFPIRFEEICYEDAMKQKFQKIAFFPYIAYLSLRMRDSFDIIRMFNLRKREMFVHYDFLVNERLYEELLEIIGKHQVENRSLDHSPLSIANPFVNAVSKRKTDIIFDSCFEGGNLDCVIKISEGVYDLFIRPDTNSNNNKLQWFFFSIKGMKHNQKIVLNICNFTEKCNLFAKGATPYFRFCKKNNFKFSPWRPLGGEIRFAISNLYKLPNMPKTFCLNFSYVCDEEDVETVYFSSALPYTYSCLDRLLTEISTHSQIFNNERIRSERLCYSEIGMSLHVWYLSEFSKDYKSKPKVLILCRNYPSHSHASWVLDGVVKRLLNHSKANLLEKFFFIVVPMLCVDGVIAGNNRCDALGTEGLFEDPNRDINRILVNFISELEETGGEIFLTFEFQSSYRREGIFLDSQPIDLKKEKWKFYMAKLLPLTLAKICKSWNREFYLLMLSESKLKSHFVKKSGFFYTFFTSLAYQNEVDKKLIPLDSDSLLEIGYNLLDSIECFLNKSVEVGYLSLSATLESPELEELATKNHEWLVQEWKREEEKIQFLRDSKKFMTFDEFDENIGLCRGKKLEKLVSEKDSITEYLRREGIRLFTGYLSSKRVESILADKFQFDSLKLRFYQRDKKINVKKPKKKKREVEEPRDNERCKTEKVQMPVEEIPKTTYVEPLMKASAPVYSTVRRVPMRLRDESSSPRNISPHSQIEILKPLSPITYQIMEMNVSKKSKSLSPESREGRNFPTHFFRYNKYLKSNPNVYKI